MKKYAISAQHFEKVMRKLENSGYYVDTHRAEGRDRENPVFHVYKRDTESSSYSVGYLQEFRDPKSGKAERYEVYGIATRSKDLVRELEKMGIKPIPSGKRRLGGKE